MDSYTYLIKKIYPARANDKTETHIYKELEKAIYKFENTKEQEELLSSSYKDAFNKLRRNIYNAIKDGYRIIRHQLDGSDIDQLEINLKRLDCPIYDINEIEEILSHSNLIFSVYDVKEAFDDTLNKKLDQSA